jgi:1-acyl-sn-glycerol-3-phosphate acyltransferase
MSNINGDLQSDYTSHLLAAMRLVGFLSLSFVLIPCYVIMSWYKPKETPDLIKLFYRSLLGVMGFKIRLHGHITTNHPTLFVSNHTSYLDIPVLGSVIPAPFVAKADVKRWPFFGFFATMMQTVFVERRIMRTGEQTEAMRSRIAKGQSLILFPEGTSSDGQRVLPFKSSFFALAEDAGKDIELTIQPVSISCTAIEGLPVTRSLRSNYSWYGDMTLIGHLWNVFRIGDVTMDIIFHPTLSPQGFKDRKALAATCQEQVARGIESCNTGRIRQEKTMLQLPAK